MSSVSNVIKLAGIASTLLASTATAQFPKRGLAANDDIPIGHFGGSWENNSSQVNWQYNWFDTLSQSSGYVSDCNKRDSTTTNKQSFLEYVPMLWSNDPVHTDVWQANVGYWLENGSGHLLGFNEPDNAGQSNLSPPDAATAYLQWITPYAPMASLGSPAITNAGASWLQTFLNDCGSCKIDFITAHWYDQATNIDYFKSYISQICGIANGLPVWLTEFQGYGTIDEQSTFLDAAIPFLDGESCVERYAYFGTADGGNTAFLENGGPILSPIGVQFTFSAY